MGEIITQITLENAVDRGMVDEGHLPEDRVRTYRMEAVVDTGTVMLMLPQDVVEKLGLRKRRRAIVTYADERKETRDIAGPLVIRIGERFMNTDCIVGPPAGEALVGQLILEGLDLIADCQNRTVHPRPESPILPLLKMK